MHYYRMQKHSIYKEQVLKEEIHKTRFRILDQWNLLIRKLTSL